MKGIFSYDGIFNRMVSRIIDCILLSFLWLLVSIPVVTMGAATTAMYYTVHKIFREEEGYLLRSFWRSFKMNFRQSTLVWLGFLVFYLVFGLNAYYGYAFFANDVLPMGMLIVIGVVAAIVMAWSCYVFPYIARFKDTSKTVRKNCVYLLVRHPLRSLALLVILLGCIVLVAGVPFGLAFAPAVGAWATNGILEPVFRLYIPKEDQEEENV